MLFRRHCLFSALACSRRGKTWPKLGQNSWRFWSIYGLQGTLPTLRYCNSLVALLIQTICQAVYAELHCLSRMSIHCRVNLNTASSCSSEEKYFLPTVRIVNDHVLCSTAALDLPFRLHIKHWQLESDLLQFLHLPNPWQLWHRWQAWSDLRQFVLSLLQRTGCKVHSTSNTIFASTAPAVSLWA